MKGGAAITVPHINGGMHYVAFTEEDTERVAKMLDAGQIKGNSLFPVQSTHDSKVTVWINMLNVGYLKMEED